MTDDAYRARLLYRREYSRKNREKLNLYQREWRAKNIERVRQYQRDYWMRKGQQMEKERE